MSEKSKARRHEKALRKLRRRQEQLSQDYAKFAFKGNIINLAIGVIIAGMFTAIVTSLNEDIITPLLSPLLKDTNFSNLFFAMDGNTYATIEEAAAAGVATVNYGKFLTAVLNFFLISIVLFFMLRYVTRTTTRLGEMRDKLRAERAEKEGEEAAKAAPPAPTVKKCPYCLSEIPIAATRCAFCTSHLPPDAEDQAENDSDRA